MNIIKDLHFSSDAWAVALPMILIAVDILTGLIYAWANKCFQSSRMRQGLSKKLGEIVIIILGELFSYGIGLPKYIMNGLLFYIGLMEFMSIIENLDKLGVPIPNKIKEVINNDVEKSTKEFMEGENDADHPEHE